MLRFVALAALMASVAIASPLRAQTIRGRLVSADSSRPVAGAIVVLRDSSNADIGRTLSGANGSFVIRMPAPGLYRLRTLRIGFRPGDFGPYRMDASDDVELLLPLADTPISLAEIRVAGQNECRARDKGGAATLAVWEEARKALVATVLTRTDLKPIVTLANYERVVDPGTGRLQSQAVRVLRGASTRPYVSPLQPDEYAVRGYVEGDASGVMYRAPDADVLLSDSFAAHHCFRLTSAADSTQVALAFRPTRQESGRIDIGGTLLVDRRTGELRSLEFQYVGLSDVVTDAGAGGRMAFVRLPTGAWVIADWELTAPRVISVRGYRNEASGSAAASSIVSRPSVRDSIADIWRIGGSLLRVSVADTVVWRGARGRLTGRVVDDADGTSIPGASLMLKSTNYTASSDARGEFVIDDVLRGSYELEVRAPMLRRLGLDVPSIVPVNLRDTATVTTTVHMLPLRKAVARACHMSDAPGSDTLAAVQGMVEGPGHAPVAGALVVARWLQHAIINERVFSSQDATATTTTSTDGSYRLCGVPDDRPLHILAMHDSLRSVETTTQVPQSPGLGTVNISMFNSGIASTTDGRAAIEGTIRNDAGAPVAGVEVEVFGVTPTRSDSLGHYRVGGLASGLYLMRVRRLGAMAQIERVEVAVGERATRDVLLRSVQLLAGVNIAATASGGLGDPDGIARRRAAGQGAFLSEGQIAARSATTTEQLLLMMQGLRIEHSTNGGTMIVQDRGSLSILNASCQGVGVFIDGSEVAQPFDVNQIPPQSIRAVEYYSGPAQTPPELRSAKTVCATLGIWTK